MANSQFGNKILIDSTGQVTSSRTKVVYAMFTPNAANDSVTLRESASDSDIMVIQGAVAKDTKYFRFEDTNLVFTKGIYVQAISSGAKLMLVTTTGGGD